MFSIIVPKGQPVKVQGKSHSFCVADEQTLLAAAFKTEVWPTLALVRQAQLRKAR